MKYWKPLLLAIALASPLCVANVAEACPMCKIANEDAEDPAVAARPKAYMYSILFMLSMPASITTFFGVTFYRMSRRTAEQGDGLSADSPV